MTVIEVIALVSGVLLSLAVGIIHVWFAMAVEKERVPALIWAGVFFAMSGLGVVWLVWP